MISPCWAIGVSDDPVLGTCLFNSPSYNNNWVVKAHPGDALVLKRVIAHPIGLCHSLHMLTRKDTWLVVRETIWNLQFTVDNSISQDFFHHFLFTWFTICSSYKEALLNCSNRFACRMFCAFLSFSDAFVWSALLRNQISIFCKVCMEQWPSTIATLIHIIALHEMLRWKYWNFSTVFKL